jgi:DNA-3-methyladenine glycosylase I
MACGDIQARALQSMPSWKFEPPKNDNEYFELMNRAIFQAGLNWKMIENKWNNFRTAFSGFSIEKLAKLGEKDVSPLMKNAGIVRNEKKIRATIFNAQASLQLRKEFGSFAHYIDSFKADHDRLLDDLQSRFHHMGPSSARTFLMMSGVKLKPTEEELAWHAKAKMKM